MVHIPWKGVVVSEQRHRFLEDYQLNYYPISESAKRINISSKTPILGTRVDGPASSCNMVWLGFKNARTDHVDVLVDRRGYRG